MASYGLLNKIENDNIYHLCSSEGGSSGSPIISLKTFKLIGIHLGGSKDREANIGLFIRYAIDEFNKIENKILNEKNKRNKFNKQKRENRKILEMYIENKNKRLTDARIPIALSMGKMEILIKKMEKQICKIRNSQDLIGTGFFCNIATRYNNNLMKSLITTNHVINESNISKGIRISMNDGYEYVNLEIKIDESRKIYTNAEYDITIIEIKESDNIEPDSFLDIDERIFGNPKEFFKNEQIILLHYAGNVNSNSSAKLRLSAGIMTRDGESKHIIYHTGQTSYCSSGGPLISLIDYKVIGFHIGKIKEEKFKNEYNIGTFLREPIKQFFNIKKMENDYGPYYRESIPSIFKEEMKRLIWMMKSSICKIECNNESYRTGFFCSLSYNGNFTRVLMTTNNILNNNDISIGKKIKFSIDNDKINYEIIIDELRKVYINEEYGITIIEIKEIYDNLEQIYFLEINKSIFEEYYYSHEIIRTQIFFLHYVDEIIKYSVGYIRGIKDQYKFYHICDTSTSSSGGPLIDTFDLKVIGIHKEESKFPNTNFGIFLKIPITKFFEKYGFKNSK